MNFFDFIIKNNIHELLIYIVIGIISYIILKSIILNKKSKLKNKRQQTMKKLIVNIIKYIIIIFIFIKVLSIIGINVTSIVAGLGIASVVIGLALQDIMKDILSGIFIIIEDQYDIGDEVIINNYQGEVIDLGIRATKIKNYESKLIIIANRNITEVTNLSKIKPNVIIDIPIPYEATNQKIDKTLQNIKNRVEQELSEIKSEVRILGIQEFAESCIKYRISVEATISKNYEIRRSINKIIKEELDKSNISIPYNIIEVKNGK